MQRVRRGAAIAAAASVICLAGCATDYQTIALGAAGIVAAGAQAPNNELEVIYYFGVFDPNDQLPPAVYRVRVRGQASLIAQARFASGWVRAELIDSLSTGGRFEKAGLTIDQSNALEATKLQTGRRLIMFGPEGFREAPKDHRLVVVMGADPSAFFKAMDTSLSVVADVQAQKQNSDLVNKLFIALSQLNGEGDRLGDLAKTVAATFPGAQ